MELFGVIAFVISIFLLASAGSVTALKRRVRKLEKRIGGKEDMSNIISALVGKQCKIAVEDALDTLRCTIAEADEEWVRVVIEKKGKTTTKIIRTDDIKSIDVVE